MSNSQLVAFRILFGLLMAGQSIYSLANGWVQSVFVEPGVNFTFIGFEWLRVLHGPFMYTYFVVMAAVAVLFSLGCFYRLSSGLLALLWTSVYLAAKPQYNNHYYLMVLLCWLMAVMPAHRRFSLDAHFKRIRVSATCPRWCILVFILQIACVYGFAGLAKINSDWLHAVPLTDWLYGKTGIPVIGHYLRNPAMPWLVAYGGLLFDVFIVPALLYKRTRLAAFVVLVLFHLFNGVVFGIGVFPFLGVMLCVFFFPSAMFDRMFEVPAIKTKTVETPVKKTAITTMVLLYAALQLFLPLRHFFIEGNVAWTEEGHRMAWQMMLRSKRGNVFFEVKDKKNDSTWYVDPAIFIKKEWVREVAVLPDVTWQAANFLKNNYAQKGLEVSVFAHTKVSLNYGAFVPLIDSTIDIASERWNYFGHNKWITPDPTQRH